MDAGDWLRGINKRIFAELVPDPANWVINQTLPVPTFLNARSQDAGPPKRQRKCPQETDVDQQQIEALQLINGKLKEKNLDVENRNAQLEAENAALMLQLQQMKAEKEASSKEVGGLEQDVKILHERLKVSDAKLQQHAGVTASVKLLQKAVAIRVGIEV